MRILSVTVSIINPHDITESSSLYHIRCFADDKDVSALVYSSSASPAKICGSQGRRQNFSVEITVISETTKVIKIAGFSDIVSHALCIIYRP